MAQDAGSRYNRPRTSFLVTSAELVYGENLTLTNNPVLDIRSSLNSIELLPLLVLRNLKPPANHAKNIADAPIDSEFGTHVLIRMDASLRQLPYEVLENG